MAHASSRANSVAPSLFYHGSEVQHAGGYAGKMSEERGERRRERGKLLLSPLILTWPPSVRLTVDQSIYLA